jgi:hypothetical protein
VPQPPCRIHPAQRETAPTSERHAAQQPKVDVEWGPRDCLILILILTLTTILILIVILILILVQTLILVHAAQQPERGAGWGAKLLPIQRRG